MWHLPTEIFDLAIKNLRKVKILKSHSGDLAEAATLEPLMLSAMVSRTVFFHIAIDGEPLGRVSFEVKDLETKKWQLI